VGARFSVPVQTGRGAYPDTCKMYTGTFPGVKSGRGVTLTPHSFQCRGQEKVELCLYSPYGPYDLYRASVPYKGSLYLCLYPYSPYGPYGLHRASVPLQRCTLTLPIPLIPLWTVRPVQSFSACTKVHFIFTYTSNTPMGRTTCTEPQCLYNGAI